MSKRLVVFLNSFLLLKVFGVKNAKNDFFFKEKMVYKINV